MNDPKAITFAGLTLEAEDPVLGIWFAGGAEHDWLAMAGVTGGRVRMAYRHRYIRDDKVWDSSDTKSFYALDGGTDTPQNRQKALGVMALVANSAAQQFGMEVWSFAGGTIKEASEWMMRQDFAHCLKSDGRES